MKPIYVTGGAMWAPGYASVDAWRHGRRDPDLHMPACKLVNPRLKRGSSRFARMLGEVVEQVAVAAGLDVAAVPTFYGSSLGEIETMVTLLRMLYEEDGKLSPNRFKNSVHNAASGLVSIGTQNTSFSTAIAGGDRSFEATLIEAWAYLAVEGGSVVLAVADDRAPEPLDVLDDHGALAVALALSLEEGGGPRLEALRESDGVERHTQLSPALRASCASPGLEILTAIDADRPGPVALSPVAGRQLVADLVWSA